MTIRVSNFEPIEPESYELANASQSFTLNCQLVTPMYGGGVEAATIDKQMPIRATGIRGQLRFWWRLLAENKNNDIWNFETAEAIRNAEFALWGGMAGGADDGGTASKVIIRVNNIQNLQIEPWAEYVPNKSDKEVLEPKKWADLPYVLFPAQGRTKENPNEPPHDLAHAGLTFDLHISYTPSLTENQRNQVVEVLRWWANFGGLGTRTRRGLGAFWVKEVVEAPEINQPLTAEEVAEAGCILRTQSNANPDALGQLRNAINRYQDFRQGVEVGRNRGQQHNRPGRSRWPEPDAIRRITGKNAPQHEPEHPAGEVFPRAAFGMPILYHFVGRGEPDGTNQISPHHPERKIERYPSPLIIRPYCTGINKEGKPLWAASVLVLPYKHLLDMQVSLDNKGSYPVWQNNTAENTRPICENKGEDPIAAFLNFFAK